MDYALMMDADDQLVIEPTVDVAAFKAAMNQDLYDLEIRSGSSRFYRPQIWSNRLDFSFKAVLHEYLEAPPGEIRRATADGVYIQVIGGGARHLNPPEIPGRRRRARSGAGGRD
jgi:hypothetical protein